MSDLGSAATNLLFWLSTTLPGLAAMLAFRTSPGRLGLIGVMAWSFVLSLCALTPLTVVAYAVSLSVDTVAACYVVVVAGAAGVIAIRLRAGRAFWRQQWLALRTPTMWVVLAVVLATLPFPGGTRWDAQMHVAKVRLILDSGFTLQDPYSPLVVMESKFHVNVLHLLHAVGANLTGQQPLEFWNDSARYFRLLTFGGIEALALSVFGVTRLAALAMLFGAPLLAGLAGGDNAVPSTVAGAVILPLLLIRLASLAARPSRSALLNASAASIALGAIHVGNYVVYVLCLVPALFAWSAFLAWRGPARVALPRAVAVLGLGAPFLYFTLSPQNHAMEQMRSEFLWELSTHQVGGMTLQMLSITRSLWQIPVAAATAAVFLLQKLQRTTFGLLAAAFAVASQWMFNPLAFRLVTEVVPYWMMRRLVVFGALAVCIVGPACVTWLLGRRIRGRLRSAVFATALLVALVALNAGTFPNSMAEMGRDREALELAGELRSLAPALRSHPLVAANPVLSLLLPSVLPATVMAPSLGNGNPADWGLVERSRARDRLLAAGTPLPERAAIVEQYHIDLAVLTAPEATALRSDGWSVVASSSSLLVLRPPRVR